jgi:hypothetical protein
MTSDAKCLVAVLLAGCAAPSATTPICPQTTDLPGTYICSGECVVTTNGTRSVQKVTGETDVISRYPGATSEMYQVLITGAGGFHELEIGPLSQNELRTATADVSDGQYPVLEEYVFAMDGQCRATGFTKLVRNPTKSAFKACRITCTKSSETKPAP